MAQLSSSELLDLEDGIMDNLTSVLTRKNVDGTLEPLMREMGLEGLLADIVGTPRPLKTWGDGQVLVVGAEPRMVDDLRGVAKGCGIAPKRLRFVEYDEATNFDFSTIEWSTRYAAILFGAVPHSASGKGEDASIIAHVEAHRDRFPECRRLCSGSRLKITKTNFREAITSLIREGALS